MQNSVSGTKTREPLLHIAKRDAIPWQRAWLIRLASIAAALIFCSIVTVLLTGVDPIKFFSTLKLAKSLRHLPKPSRRIQNRHEAPTFKFAVTRRVQ